MKKRRSNKKRQPNKKRQSNKKRRSPKLFNKLVNNLFRKFSANHIPKKQKNKL